MFKLCTLFKRNLCPQGHSNSFHCRTHTHTHTHCLSLCVPSQFKHRSAKLSLSCFRCIASHSSIIYQFIHSPLESHLANNVKDYVVNAIPATLSFLKLAVSSLWLCGWFLATLTTRMKSVEIPVSLFSHTSPSPLPPPPSSHTNACADVDSVIQLTEKALWLVPGHFDDQDDVSGVTSVFLESHCPHLSPHPPSPCNHPNACVDVDSIIQLTEQRHPPVDPVALRLVSGQVDGQDIVGGVTGGGQRAPPCRRLVHRTLVRLLLFKLGRLPRLQPDLRGALRN